MNARLSPTSWVTVQTVYTQAFGALVFAVQAPLLGPRVFGLVAIVMVFVTLCDAMLDTATDALISVHDIEPRHYAVMNTLIVLLAGLAGAGLMLGARALAAWFGAPELAPATRVMAVLPLLTGLESAPNAAAKRSMEFGQLAVRMMSGVTCGGVVGITLAVMGAGLWALVAQAVVQRLVCLVVLWWVSPLPPAVSVSRRHWDDLSGFVWPLLLAKVMSWGSTQLPRFVLALNLTVVELGLYSMAARLADIAVSVTTVPRAAVARVALRRYARDRAGLEEAVVQFVRSMSLVTFPLSVGGFVLAPLLVHAWLNPKWFAAIVPAQALLLASATWVTFYGGGVLFLAIGPQRNEAMMSVLQTVTMAAVGWYFGRHGLIAVALALGVRPLLLIPLETILVRRSCGIPVGAFLGGQLIPLAAAAGSGLVVWSIRNSAAALLGTGPALMALGVCGLGIYALLIRLMAPQAMRRAFPRLQP